MRDHCTKKRGRIGFIASGTKTIVGEVTLIDCLGPLTKEQFEQNKHKHHSSRTFEQQPYKKLYAWIFNNPRRYPKPIPYHHPQGAIIWVKLKQSSRN